MSDEEEEPEAQVTQEEKGTPVAEAAGEVYLSTPSTGTGGSGSENTKTNSTTEEKGRKLGP